MSNRGKAFSLGLIHLCSEPPPSLDFIGVAESSSAERGRVEIEASLLDHVWTIVGLRLPKSSFQFLLGTVEDTRDLFCGDSQFCLNVSGFHVVRVG